MNISYTTRLFNRFPEFQGNLLPIHPQIFLNRRTNLDIYSIISYYDRYGDLSLGTVINKLPSQNHCVVLPLGHIPSSCGFFTPQVTHDGSNKMEFLEAFLELIRVSQIQTIHDVASDMYRFLEIYRNTQDLPWPNQYFIKSSEERDAALLAYQQAVAQQNFQALNLSGIGTVGSIIL